MPNTKRSYISSWNEIIKKQGKWYNPETTDTKRTDKDDTSHTNYDDSNKKLEGMKNTIDDDKYKEDTLQPQDVNESVDNC